MAALGPAAAMLALWALASAPVPPIRPPVSAPPDATATVEQPSAPDPAATPPASAPAGESGLAPATSATPAAAAPERLAHEVKESLLAPREDALPAETPTPPPGGEAPSTASQPEDAPATERVAIRTATTERRPLPRPGDATGAAPGPALAPVPETPAADADAPGAGTEPMQAPLPPRREDASGKRTAPARSDDESEAPAKLILANLPSAKTARLTPEAGATIRQPDQFVCRDPRLAGAVIPAIGSLGAPCGIPNPVRLTGIAGIDFDSPATVDCPTARRIAHWLTGVAQPLAESQLGSRIVEVDVMGSYACRTRNHRPGGRISEHARGRALDVGGFRLADGRQISVLEDWGKGGAGQFLKSLQKESCGLFMTVLGPNSDRHHKNHFHLDTAERRGKPYCR